MTKENNTQTGDDIDMLDDIIDGAIAQDDDADNTPREDDPQDTQDDDDTQDDNSDDTEEALDDDSGDPDDDDDPSSADNGDKPKKQSRLDKRIGKLTRAQKDAQREAEYWKSRAEALATTRQPEPQVTQEQIDMGAQQGLTPEQVSTQIKTEAAALVERERFESTAQTLRERLESQGAGDALSRLSNPALTNFEPEAVDALASAKYPIKVANALHENEALFNQFRGKSPVQQAMLIARLDGRLEAQASGKKQASSVKATPKIRGVARPPSKNPDDMSQAEYEAYAKKKGWL